MRSKVSLIGLLGLQLQRASGREGSRSVMAEGFPFPCWYDVKFENRLNPYRDGSGSVQIKSFLRIPHRGCDLLWFMLDETRVTTFLLGLRFGFQKLTYA